MAMGPEALGGGGLKQISINSQFRPWSKAKNRKMDVINYTSHIPEQEASKT